jgi:hypothetical protein
VLYWEGHKSSIQVAIEVNEYLMEILFDKLSNRSGPTSNHIVKVFKSSLQSAIISAGCCNIVLGWSCNLGTLAQVGALPNYVENTSKMSKDVLLLGHHLRMQAKASKLSWRPNPCQVQDHLGLQGAACSKTDAHVAYGLCFQQSTYGWNDNLKR